MSEPHFHYGLTPEELAKLGELALTWSHTEHLIGTCTKSVLGLTEEQADILIYPLSADRRMQLLKQHSGRVSPELQALIKELQTVMKAISIARNTAVHAIIIDNWEVPKFRLHSKDRVLTKEDILQSDALSNYATLLALHIRFKLDPAKLDGGTLKLPPLPTRPEIPKTLQQKKT